MIQEGKDNRFIVLQLNGRFNLEQTVTGKFFYFLEKKR